jgi:lysophospholipase L1-like esterase
LWAGVTDLGAAAAPQAAQQAIGDQIIAAYKQFILRAHAAGLPMFAATITPFSEPGFTVTVQPYSSAVREATRQRVNDFIRNGGWFDAFADFDAVVRDPSNPSSLSAQFNSGDFLHPNVAGYTAIAKAFPVDIFTEFENGVDGWA